jgi:hypothetical protein
MIEVVWSLISQVQAMSVKNGKLSMALKAVQSDCGLVSSNPREVVVQS